MGFENEGWGKETPISKKRNAVYQIIAGAVFLLIMGTTWYTCNLPPFDKEQKQQPPKEKKKSSEILNAKEMRGIFLQKHRVNMRLKIAPEAAAKIDGYNRKAAKVPGFA